MSESLSVEPATAPFSAAEMATAVAGGERVVDGLAKLESDPAVRVARLARSLGLRRWGTGA